MDPYGIGTAYDEGTGTFSFREPIVLLPIIFLSLLKGIAHSQDQNRFMSHMESGNIGNSMQYYSIVRSLGPFPTIILMTFLSEIRGRKLIFYILFALTVLSSILSFIPYQQPWATMENFIATSLKEGALAITGLAVCEYCSPKHRLAFLVAHRAADTVGAMITSILYKTEVLNKESSYLSLCVVAAGLACAGSVWWWPESPYWLAARGRRGEARAALLWLRGEGEAARGELQALLKARRRPSPKLFWLALLITVIAVTVAVFSIAAAQKLIVTVSFRIDDVVPQTTQYIILACSTFLVSIIIISISYELRRKVVYVGAAVVPFVMLYIISLWIYLETQMNDHYPMVFFIAVVICSTLLECGPYVFGLSVLVEFTPQKYYTYISAISSMFFIISSTIVVIVTNMINIYGSILFLATLSLLGVALIYWLSPETRKQSLFDIENSYMRRLYGESVEQGEVTLEVRAI